MRRSDDSLRDFALWDDDQEEKLNKRPLCNYCGQRIQDDCYYELNGEIYCQDCIDDNKRYFEED